MLSLSSSLFSYCNLLVYMKMSHISKRRPFFVTAVRFKRKRNYFSMRETLMTFHQRHREINLPLNSRDFKSIKVFSIWCETVPLPNNGLLKTASNGAIWRTHFPIYALSLHRTSFYYDYSRENGLIKKIIVGVHKNIIDKGGEKKSLRNLGEPHCTLYH